MGWFTRGVKPIKRQLMFFDVEVLVARIKDGNNVVVPAKNGLKFHPTFAAMVSTGSAATSTTVRLVESTTAGVVLSHVVADLDDGNWAGPTGGTPVTTKLNTDCAIGEGLKLVDAVANSLTGTTKIRVVVAGYYV